MTQKEMVAAIMTDPRIPLVQKVVQKTYPYHTPTNYQDK